MNKYKTALKWALWRGGLLSALLLYYTIYSIFIMKNGLIAGVGYITYFIGYLIAGTGPALYGVHVNALTSIPIIYTSYIIDAHHYLQWRINLFRVLSYLLIALLAWQVVGYGLMVFSHEVLMASPSMTSTARETVETYKIYIQPFLLIMFAYAIIKALKTLWTTVHK